VICVHTPLLPVHDHDSLSHESFQARPDTDRVEAQNLLPLFASKARTRPFAFVL